MSSMANTVAIRRKRALLTFLNQDLSLIDKIVEKGMMYGFDGEYYLLMSKADNSLLVGLVKTFNWPLTSTVMGEVKYRGMTYIVRKCWWK